MEDIDTVEVIDWAEYGPLYEERHWEIGEPVSGATISPIWKPSRSTRMIASKPRRLPRRWRCGG
jgi:hypothetical protein